MAVLEKIRVRMGVFITVLIAIALLSFIIDPSTLQSTLNMFSSKNNVGSMNGSGISYQEFAKKIQYYTDIQTLLSGANSLDEQATEAVNNGAWQDFLSEKVIMPAVEKAGIYLGNDELFDLTQGKEISPVLQQNPIFRGEEGVFDPTKVAEFVQNISRDQSGNYSKYWSFLEKSIKEEHVMSKYNSLLTKSLYNTPVELRRNMEEHNQAADVDFVLSPIGFNRDTTITVTSDEIRDYYNKHVAEYEQEATRDFSYVVFNIEPSVKDMEDAYQAINKSYPDFLESTNLKQFLARNSDTPWDANYYKKGELTSISPALENWAFTAAVGSVLPVYQEGKAYRAARLMDIKQLPDSVMVHHIMIQNPDDAKAKALCDSLLNVVNRGGNFAALAEQYSADKGGGREPGVLGWLTQRYMVPGFETVFTAPVNKAFVLHTQYGWHLVKVTERTKLQNKVQVAVLLKNPVAGKETFQDYYAQANGLSTSCTTTEEFDAYAKEHGWSVLPAMAVKENARRIGSYGNTREIIRWSFDGKTKVGAVSPVFSVENKYFFVANLTNLHKEGTATVQERAGEIRDILIREKKMAKVMDKVRADLQGCATLQEYADKVGATITSRTGVVFGSDGTPSTDARFTGAVAAAEAGKLVGPVEGLTGVYVMQVKDRQMGAYYTEEDAARQNVNVLNVQGRMLMPVLDKACKVVDRRAKFF